MKIALIALFLVGYSLFAVACISATPTGMTIAADKYSAVMVTSDLSVGTNRVSFGLVDMEGQPIQSDSVDVTSVYFPPEEEKGILKEEVTARFVHWPPYDGSKGVFVTELYFDVKGPATITDPGLWGIEISAITKDGTQVEARTVLTVNEFSKTPAIGDIAPASSTPTLMDVSDLGHITSDVDPDPDLYQVSIDDAIVDDKALVLIFSTPAFCVSATCGPQLEIIKNIKTRYMGVNFIHVEAFQDPHLIKEGIISLEPVRTMDEWGLTTEPWTFVVDSDGRVRAKFEQFVTEDEIVIALEEAL
ncbi:MAG: hypothetical protein EGP14_00215 [SAR202 cluster bacterium]|jgi:hypothetical protein|nr:MAG: hypothetical protein EGP14_00215 [SAR202 cluster bacterium]GIS82104.1 MAG: thiol reductase thioredoxin [Dehalococcoidia bacterium]